jgi:hypothetical protein
MIAGYRSLLEVFREALRTLQDEPGPMTPEKSALLRYLRERIAANTDPHPLEQASE